MRELRVFQALIEEMSEVHYYVDIAVSERSFRKKCRKIGKVVSVKDMTSEFSNKQEQGLIQADESQLSKTCRMGQSIIIPLSSPQRK